MSEPQSSSVPPYAQPGGYPPAGAPQGPYPRAADATAGGNPLARTAFVIALVTVGLGLLLTVARPVIHAATQFQPEAMTVISLVHTAVSLLGGLAALILGLIALRRPGGQVAAGVAVGVGVTVVLGSVFSWATPLIFQLFA